MWSNLSVTNFKLYQTILDRIQENYYDLGLIYHNHDHVLDLYDYLEETDEPYDLALDYAVLFHDYIYDALPDKELRSAEAFLQIAKTSDIYELKDSEFRGKVYDFIMSTKKHSATKDNSAIIRADLAGLINKTKTIINFANIMEESKNLYDITDEEFANSNITFMNGLFFRIVDNMISDPDHKDFWEKVLDGIELTRKLSDLILNK